MSRDEIKALDTREQCRLKLPVFYGSVDNYLHGFREVLANGTDEIDNNFNDGEINIELFNDNETISVEDSGRGVPIDLTNDEKGNEVLLFETLFAGTNFDNNINGKQTTGTNGVGTCVLNHVSDLFQVDSYRNGNHTCLKYSQGGQNKKIETISSTDKHGTKFTFKLDKSVYPNTIYTIDEIKDIVRHVSATCNNINFNIKYNDEIINYKYDTLEDYFDSLSNNLTSKKIIFPKKDIIHKYKVGQKAHGKNETIYEDREEHDSLSLIVSTSPFIFQESYLNHNYLPEGGTINDGVLEGFKIAVNNYCKDKKMFTNKIKTISKEDIQASLCFVIDFRTNDVEYTNQTKYATKKKTYSKVSKDYVLDFLESYIIENDDNFKMICKHILQIADFNNKSNKLKNEFKKKLSEGIEAFSGRVGGLTDCRYHNEDSEIFISEGKSAKGSLVLARDPNIQAVFPIRGKILNCLKATPEEIIKSPIITNLIKALGCGIDFREKKHKDLNNFDIAKLRYGKIVVASDQDFDGLAIQALVLTMIYALMRPLLTEGKVYIAQTPLFVITEIKTDKKYYAFNDDEKDKIVNSIGKSRVNRLKGLGEADSQIMYDTALNPKTRQMIKVTVDDVEEMISKFDKWMNKEVEDRKEFIIENLYKYINDEE